MSRANSWQVYFDKTKNKPINPFHVRAFNLVQKKDEALDLGAGALVHSKYLLDLGFKHVTAVDLNKVSDDILDTLAKDRFNYHISSFEKFDFTENKYDLINTSYSLPFNPPQSIEQVFNKIKRSLKTGGIFVGQFFGDRDSWKKTKPEMTFHTRQQVEQLLSGLEIIELSEEEKDSKPTIGVLKHWHLFHVIARKH